MENKQESPTTYRGEGLPEEETKSVTAGESHTSPDLSSEDQKKSAAVRKAAIKRIQNGFFVFPCREKPETINGTLYLEKSPYTRHGFHDASTDIDTINSWWNSYPAALIGMLTGSVNGFFVLDVDNKHGVNGSTTLAELEAKHGKLPRTLTVRTPTGGYHYYFKMPDFPIRNMQGKLGKTNCPGLDIRGDGGYIIYPPSTLADGRKYAVTVTLPMAKAPDWLLTLLREEPRPVGEIIPVTTLSGEIDPYVAAAINNLLNEIRTVAQGGRNSTTSTNCHTLGKIVNGGHVGCIDMEQQIRNAANSNPDRLSDKEIENCIKCLYKTIESGEVFTIPRAEADTVVQYTTKVVYEKGKTQKGSTQAEAVEVQTSVDYLPPPPPVPFDVFHPDIASLIRELSATFDTPDQIAMAAVLGFLSALIGGARRIRIKPDFEESGVLWVAIVAESGIGKSPCSNAVMDYLFDLEMEFSDSYKVAVCGYERELEDYQISETAYRKAKSRDDSAQRLIENKPEPPILQHLTLDDTTQEAVTIALEGNPKGIQINRDEINGFLLDMDKYSTGKGGGFRCRLLTAYNGGLWKVTRAFDRKVTTIRHAHVGIFGGIQPEILHKAFNADQDSADGFLQRITFIRADQDASSLLTSHSLSDKAKGTLKKLASVMSGWEPVGSPRDKNSLLHTDIIDGGKCFQMVAAWYEGLARRRVYDPDRVAKTILPKMKSKTIRLCDILHCSDAVLNGQSELNPVSPVCMERAIKLAENLFEHQLQILSLLRGEKAARPNKLEDAIMKVVVVNQKQITKDGYRIAAGSLTSQVCALMGEQVDGRIIGKLATKLGMVSKKVGTRSGRFRAYEITPAKILGFKGRLSLDTLDTVDTALTTKALSASSEENSHGTQQSSLDTNTEAVNKIPDSPDLVKNGQETGGVQCNPTGVPLVSSELDTHNSLSHNTLSTVSSVSSEKHKVESENQKNEGGAAVSAQQLNQTALNFVTEADLFF